jgi:phage repressor protein C with HTH and peptisase S24 domain
MVCNNAAFSCRTIAGMDQSEKTLHPSVARLYAVAADNGDDMPARVAERLRVSPQTLNNWESRGISKEGALQAQDVYGCDANWLRGLTDEAAAIQPPAMPDSWPDVRGYAQAVGLGNGAEAAEYEETHKLKFRADSLARQGLRPDNLAVVYGKGDSMLPRIHPGDAILFDTSDTRPMDGHLYVIAVDGAANLEYNVKRCEIIDDEVFFRADNPAGDHNWKRARRMDSKRSPIRVIGRVRWIGSWEG